MQIENKDDEEGEDEEHVIELEQSISEDPETQKEKRERLDSNNQHFYTFFNSFLKQEIIQSILPNLRLVFQKDSFKPTNDNFKMPETDDAFYEALLQSADKRNAKNSHRALHKSKV